MPVLPERSVSILKQRLVKALSELDRNILRDSVEHLPRRLRAVIKAIEDHYCLFFAYMTHAFTERDQNVELSTIYS